MRELIKVLLVLLFIVAAAWAVQIYAFPKQEVVAGSAVKTLVGDSHGSGVYIGNGHFLTAAHVVGDSKDVQIKTDLGRLVNAEVLWTSAVYDIAMMKVSQDITIVPAELACRPAMVGEELRASGNPKDMQFLSFRGFVSGEDRELAIWKLITPVDMTILPGMSGGPVFDHWGRVIGISVATRFIATPSGLGQTWVRMGAMVPSHVICDLLGRNA